MDLPPSTNKRKLKISTGKNRFVRYGVPFLLLVVGGSFGLKEFQNIKFKYFRNTSVSPEVMAKYGIDMKKKGEVTLETEFEKVKQIDIDNWTNIRGPRPWE
ncbi:Cytochrome c oxidase assembly protein COX16 like, mitochondrial [Pseudolycoriella hygida]|uniref:Cytochrome c oxidase assembly protein COX16 homolog, mitochondrial n=1 Tax=Pseudolycoriella hygida TaxID=35572 RepID=A0A9Q0MRL0_9DIPT|nr:Cytochrome c oxidase assembly protein COX16 like, mitochondrial [Pseudolycoriella hygida]